MTNTDPSETYRRAKGLERAMIAATTAANNPELAYPDWPDTTPLPDLGRGEVAAEIAYYSFLDEHRAELGQHSDFRIEYGVLDALAAEQRSVTDLFTDTGDPEERHRDPDRRRSR
ncbi:hypothetical protein IU470_13090 [Nocardia abscessus]|uniref:Uncharacterized protein n=1 Tax=Nocardia abscessus TaxID=120957 RepID=A0ABS0C8D0_9NOCA|nr:hypothetical protein [Nocardia abscessus]MBF6226031.1 hypothetical protein [Nocardia abscessus]